MTPERWKRIEKLLEQALERDASQRTVFIDQACAGDEGLRREVESLLKQYSRVDDFLEAPALEGAARELASDERSSLVGQQIGHYQILSRLGEGGMGIVYKARDTHLDRFLAIKVLPTELVADTDRKRRFVQEAKAASALNHPNIITIHDIARENDRDFMVMEYVDGKTLGELMPRRGLKLNEVLKYAIQMADALAKAHGAGIIHRDLKPGNIMVSEAGLIKLLDFGLAKLTERPRPYEIESTGSLTEEGVIVGTASYMSPEQAEGKEVDARSDIFSFGSVLYEMVTGRSAFQGDTNASTIAAILKEEPQPPSQIVQALPPELERIVRRCLRKDRSQRFQHMDDLKVALEELKQESDSGALEPSSSVVRKRRPYSVFGSLIITSLALGAATWYWSHRSRPTSLEASLAAVPLTSYSGVEESPSFSPDGSQVAFSWNGDKQDNYDIYAKLIGAENRLHLTTNPARDYSPAWSPDGRWIAFRRDLPGPKVAVLLIPPIGGPERLLTETYPTDPYAVMGPFLAWSPDSHSLIIVDCDSPNKQAGLLLFSVETNEKRRLTSPPGDSIADSGPAFSPDGHSLAFSRESRSGSSDLYLLNLSDDLDPIGEPARLTLTNQRPSSPVWTSDGNEIVFFSRSGMSSGLWRMPVSKPAKPWKLAFAPDLARTPAISRQGNRLAYAVGTYDDNIWRVDLRGPDQKPASPVRFISSTRREFTAEYSPDGKRIAFVSERSGTPEIWVCDSDGLNATKLTSFGGPRVFGQKWSPDSQSIAFMANRGDQQIYVIGASGGAARHLVTGPANDNWPYWSRDGQWLYFRSARKEESEIWKVPTKGGEEIQVTRDDLADYPHESPDGKWLYYSKGWPGPQSVWRIPVEGGEPTKVLDAVHHFGLWTVGKEGIYYFSVSDEKGHTDINLYEFAMGTKKKLLTIDSPEPQVIAVSPDGQSILFTKSDESGSDLMLVENFR